jgi:mono/diheme cytochrome c family protein
VIGRRLAVVSLGCALVGCAGPTDPDAIAPCPPPPDAAVLAALPAGETAVGDAGRGAEIFERECAKCHSRRLVARSSRLFHDYPRLDCPDSLARVPDAYLYRAIADGGLAIGRDEAMKPFRELLGDAGIADVIAHLRSARDGAR